MNKIALFGLVLHALMFFAAAAENVKQIKAIAVLNGEGVSGNVTFTQNGCGEAVFVEIFVLGLTPGHHGFHVHEKGDLSGGCASTGSHYNPDKLDHGAPEDQVRHVGDLGNIVADEAGIVRTQITDKLITLAGPRSVVGRAVVVHSGVDDLGKGNQPDSKKTGNAGGRVACGVIGIVSPTTALPSNGLRNSFAMTSLLLTVVPLICLFV